MAALASRLEAPVEALFPAASVRHVTADRFEQTLLSTTFGMKGL